MSLTNVDFTSFTEVDPNSRLAVTSTKVTITSLSAKELCYVYKDYGANYFDGDFEHQFQFKFSAIDSYGFLDLWNMKNVNSGSRQSTDDALYLYMYRAGSGTPTLYLGETNGGTNLSDTMAIASGTDYYVTIKRDESVGTYGKIYCYVYSDSSRETLLDTLEVTLREKVDFKYLFMPNRHGNPNASATTSATIENLKISEAANKTNFFQLF